eukprot:scaffold1862_cov576-Prasinococcus_capsulatus_cf.AAC.6
MQAGLLKLLKVSVHRFVETDNVAFAGRLTSDDCHRSSQERFPTSHLPCTVRMSQRYPRQSSPRVLTALGHSAFRLCSRCAAVSPP